MQILPVNNYSYSSIKPNKPTFGGNCREVLDKNKNLLYRTTTYFFRNDLDWEAFFGLLARNYQHVPKVNFINHCCSNGEEAYSCATGLMVHLQDMAEKFFPILAKDINHENIESAKNHSKMGINTRDVYQLNYYTHDNYRSFFDVVKPNSDIYSMALVPKENLKKSVIFEKGDILSDVDNIPSKNTVLLCRNFWPYLDAFKREELAQKLENRLEASSLVVIGDYDMYEAKVDELLLQHNFLPTTVKNVFAKAPKIESVSYKFTNKYLGG